MSRKGAVYCCQLCGRDTTARGGICGRCTGGDFAPKDEMRGRGRAGEEPAVGRKLLDDPDHVEPWADELGRDYHGDTARDDI